MLNRPIPAAVFCNTVPAFPRIIVTWNNVRTHVTFLPQLKTTQVPKSARRSHVLFQGRVGSGGWQELPQGRGEEMLIGSVGSKFVGLRRVCENKSISLFLCRALLKQRRGKTWQKHESPCFAYVHSYVHVFCNWTREKQIGMKGGWESEGVREK